MARASGPRIVNYALFGEVAEARFKSLADALGAQAEVKLAAE